MECESPSRKAGSMLPGSMLLGQKSIARPALEPQATARCSSTGCATRSSKLGGRHQQHAAAFCPFHARPACPWVQSARSKGSPSRGGRLPSLRHAAEDEAYASYLAHIVDLSLGAFLLFGYALAAILIFTLQQVGGCKPGGAVCRRRRGGGLPGGLRRAHRVHADLTRTAETAVLLSPAGIYQSV